jgi:hypothetical protein
VALNLLILVGEEVDERREETGFDDGRFVGGVDGDVADAGGGGEDKREEGGTEEAKEGRETAVLDDFDLVLLYSGGTGEQEDEE